MITLPGLVPRALGVNSVLSLIDLCVLTLQAASRLLLGASQQSTLAAADLQVASQHLAKLRREILDGTLIL